MAAPPVNDDLIDSVLRALEEHGGNQTRAAESLGIPRGTLQSRMRSAKLRWNSVPPPKPAVRVTPPPPDEPIESLLARKKAMFGRSQQVEEWAQLIPVEVTANGPIGLLLVGDPHLDDDGCDIAAIEDDLSIVGKTSGAFAGHLGDLTNNWLGRLAHLYANQTTRFDEALRLVRWMLDLCPSLFVVGGNHDCWNRGMDLLRFVVAQGNSQVLRAHGARLELTWPGGGSMRIHARHDFPGRSQYSPAHGMRRELLWGHRDDLIVCGHIHTDEYSLTPGVDGVAHALFRVSGYKLIDEHARAQHYRERRLGPSVFVILDPAARKQADRVKPWWDVAEGAAYLTWIRKRRSAA